MTKVPVRKQEKIRRRLGHLRHDADAYDASLRWGQRRCLFKSIDVLRNCYRDYFQFETYKNDRGDIFVRSTLKILKDD